MAEDERIVAVGLLTEQDLTVLGQGFRRLFRIDEEHEFGALLAAIDRAEQAHEQAMARPVRPTRF